jgi:hypothetical protein
MQQNKDGNTMTEAITLLSGMPFFASRHRSWHNATSTVEDMRPAASELSSA